MNMNSGYVGWSISRRAATAYDNGLAPLSKIGSGKWIKAAASLVGAAEWHHTSKYANRTDFYSPAAVRGAAAHLKTLASSPEAALAVIAAKRRARAMARVGRSPRNKLAIVRELKAIAARSAREEDAAHCRARVAQIIAEMRR